MSVSTSARSVTFSPAGLAVDGRYRPLVGAEFHFWRQQAGFWAPTLTAIAEAGIDLVSTFVCWDFHELEPGRFDFSGATAPERNLVGFLELCAERELGVILRPGPIIDAEWESRGPAKDVCTLERNDPRFLERAREYLAAVAAVAAPYQASRGGPIVLVAVDNEIFFPYNSDYSWHEEDGDVFVPYKRDFARASFQKWLVERYTRVEELNANLGTRYASFDEIDVPNYATDPSGVIQASFEFIDEYCACYLDTLVETLRANGIDVPLYTNQKQFLAFLDWSVAGRSLDNVGLNLCMPDLVPGRQALTVSWFIRLQRMRRNHFPWSPEYQAGWIGFDKTYGVISPEHGLYMGLLGAALGLRGMSFFMFVERDDWNWSPVNSFGKVRPRRHAAYRTVVDVLKTLEADEQFADLALLWSLREQREHLAATTPGWEDLFKHWMELEEEKERPRWWRTFVRLHAEDADFRLVDLDSDAGDWPQVLLYAGDGPLNEAELARLAGALAEGRVLIAVGRLDAADHARLSERGSVIRCRIDEAWRSAQEAGANAYVTASGGAWSFGYGAAEGTRTVFVLNPGERPARTALSGDLCSRAGRWEELVTRRSGRGTLNEALAACDRLVPPKTVYVFRIEPD